MLDLQAVTATTAKHVAPFLRDRDAVRLCTPTSPLPPFIPSLKGKRGVFPHERPCGQANHPKRRSNTYGIRKIDKLDT